MRKWCHKVQRKRKSRTNMQAWLHWMKIPHDRESGLDPAPSNLNAAGPSAKIILLRHKVTVITRGRPITTKRRKFEAKLYGHGI